MRHDDEPGADWTSGAVYIGGGVLVGAVVVGIIVLIRSVIEVAT